MAVISHREHTGSLTVKAHNVQPKISRIYLIFIFIGFQLPNCYLIDRNQTFILIMNIDNTSNFSISHFCITVEFYKTSIFVQPQLPKQFKSIWSRLIGVLYIG